VPRQRGLDDFGVRQAGTWGGLEVDFTELGEAVQDFDFRFRFSGLLQPAMRSLKQDACH